MIHNVNHLQSNHIIPALTQPHNWKVGSNDAKYQIIQVLGKQQVQKYLQSN